MSVPTTTVLLVGLATHFLASTCFLAGAWAQCPSGSTALTPSGANAWTSDAVVFDDGSGPALYIGGSFTNVGGTPALRVARWHGNAFSGGGWSAVGDGLPGHVWDLAVLDLGDGPHLYAAGSGPGGFVARWSGANWDSLGTHLGLGVRAIAAFDVEGVPRLFAGGNDMDSLENFVPMVIQRVNDAWSFVPNGPTTNPTEHWPTWLLTGAVDSLAVHDDGSGPQLYVGGSFHRVSGAPCMNLARWNGTSWSTVGGGIGTYPNSVSDLCVYDDGSGAALYMNESISGNSCLKRWTGSTFESVGGPFPGRIEGITAAGPMLGRPAGLWVLGTFGTPAWQAGIGFFDGTTWTIGNLPFGSGGSTILSALTPFEEAGVSRILAVGNFAHGIPAVQNVLRFDGATFSAVVGCTEVGETFCHGDGLEAACPCGNDSDAGARAGCLNSLGLGGSLRAEGRASLSGDTLVLRGAQMPNSSALYFQAGTRHAPVPFGDGHKCTGGPFVRLGTAVNAAQSSSYPGIGELSISERGQIGGPGTRHYQARYRNAAVYCTTATFNYTNAVTIVWGI